MIPLYGMPDSAIDPITAMHACYVDEYIMAFRYTIVRHQSSDHILFCTYNRSGKLWCIMYSKRYTIDEPILLNYCTSRIWIGSWIKQGHCAPEHWTVVHLHLGRGASLILIFISSSPSFFFVEPAPKNLHQF